MILHETLGSILISFLMLWSGPPATQGARPEVPAISGAYTVEVDGKPAGSEKVNSVARPEGALITSTGEMTDETGSRKVETSTEMTGNRPSKYTIVLTRGTSTQKYEVSFENRRIRVRVESGGRSTERIVQAGENAVLLDRNIWHQYAFLLSRYRMEKGGVQHFNVFMPQAGLRMLPVDVEFRKKVTVKTGDTKREANRFLITIARGLQVEATADRSGVPIQIEIPGQQLKAVLK